MGLTRPAPLAPDHDLSRFDCGEPAVDRWLAQHAVRNQASGASRVFVVCEQRRVVGFYAVAAGGVVRRRAAGRLARGMPDPIPVMVLGQLGVDRAWQRRGVARGMVRDALLRAVTVTDDVGVAAVYVDVLSPDLSGFYQGLGFRPIAAAEPGAMMIRMKDVRAVLASL